MLAIFESILPVFLLVVLGALLKRWRAIDRDMWGGLEQLGFYVLFPALLFVTLAEAEFDGCHLPLLPTGEKVAAAG